MNETHGVVVTFTGICVHCENVPLIRPDDAVEGEPQPTSGRYRRTVIVNATHGLRHKDRSVPPHSARLRIRKDFIVGHVPDNIPGLQRIDPEHEKLATWDMHGVRLYIANARHGLKCCESFCYVPSLTRCADRLSLQLDERVVLEGRAAAVFDIFAGELDAYRTQDAAVAVRGKLTVHTARQPQLVITEMWSQKTTTLRLQAACVGEQWCAPHISVMNMGEHEDKDDDFYLSYHVTTWSPPPGATPHPGAVRHVRLITDEERKCLDAPISGLSIGCSNTIYP